MGSKVKIQERIIFFAKLAHEEAQKAKTCRHARRIRAEGVRNMRFIVLLYVCIHVRQGDTTRTAQMNHPTPTFARLAAQIKCILDEGSLGRIQGVGGPSHGDGDAHAHHDNLREWCQDAVADQDSHRPRDSER